MLPRVLGDGRQAYDNSHPHPGNVLLRGLDDDQQAAMISAMTSREMAAGEDLFAIGDEGDHFYVVASGEYHLYTLPPSFIDASATSAHKYIERGGFGELALLYNSAREETLRCHRAGE